MTPAGRFVATFVVGGFLGIGSSTHHHSETLNSGEKCTARVTAATERVMAMDREMTDLTNGNGQPSQEITEITVTTLLDQYRTGAGINIDAFKADNSAVITWILVNIAEISLPQEPCLTGGIEYARTRLTSLQNFWEQLKTELANTKSPKTPEEIARDLVAFYTQYAEVIAGLEKLNEINEALIPETSLDLITPIPTGTPLPADTFITSNQG